jgi:proline-specific peptidase
MWGPSEFYATGTLKDWDITSRLGEIRVPALVLGGKFDEATPVITETIHKGIPGSEWVIFENSAHFPHIEETELYLQVLSKFLERAEANLSHNTK